MPLLSLDGVEKRYARGYRELLALDGVSLDVERGDFVAIWGGSRSGKTTLLRVAAGIEAPDAGEVRLEGQDLLALSAAERTRRLRQVGYVPKEWRVAHGKPVVDHVALPLLADGRPLASAMAKAHEALELVGVGGCSSATADDLTPGELGRVALARALVRNPRVLLVDEPGVTAEAGERDGLLALLRSIAAQRREDLGIVITSRDVAGLGGAEHVMSLGDGRLRSFEQPAEVVALPVRRTAPPEPEPAR